MNEEELKNESEQVEKPFTDQGEFDPNLKDKIKLHGHNWKQRGYEIFCESCPLHHSSYIGSRHILVGIDEKGFPRFAKRS